jgi:hypothetical protein
MQLLKYFLITSGCAIVIGMLINNSVNIYDKADGVKNSVSDYYSLNFLEQHKDMIVNFHNYDEMGQIQLYEESDVIKERTVLITLTNGTIDYQKVYHVEKDYKLLSEFLMNKNFYKLDIKNQNYNVFSNHNLNPIEIRFNDLNTVESLLHLNTNFFEFNMVYPNKYYKLIYYSFKDKEIYLHGYKANNAFYYDAYGTTLDGVLDVKYYKYIVGNIFFAIIVIMANVLFIFCF